jgi:hypothetical protein
VRVTDANIVESNAFGFENPAQNNNEWLAVYNHISRINHSCVPNARTSDICTSVDANPNPNHTGQMKVIATKDIALGEEITIEYLKDALFWMRPRNLRVFELRTHWHFDCNCNACPPALWIFADSTWAFTRSLGTGMRKPISVKQPYVLARRIDAAERYIHT